MDGQPADRPLPPGGGTSRWYHPSQHHGKYPPSPSNGKAQPYSSMPDCVPEGAHQIGIDDDLLNLEKAGMSPTPNKHDKGTFEEEPAHRQHDRSRNLYIHLSLSAAPSTAFNESVKIQKPRLFKRGSPERRWNTNCTQSSFGTAITRSLMLNRSGHALAGKGPGTALIIPTVSTSSIA